jgi:hypothetical protein
MTGNSVDPQYPPFCLSCRETLLVFFRAAESSGVTCGAVKGALKGAFILTLDSPASYFTIELGTKRNAVQLSFVP